MSRYIQWLQNGVYPASVDRLLIGALWPRAASVGLAASPQPGTMNVTLTAGQVAVPTGVNAAVLCSSDQTEIVTHQAAPPSGQSRIDLIIARPRSGDLGPAGPDDFIFDVVTGVAAASPSVPALPATTALLHVVTIPGGSVAITAGMIADARPGGLAVPAYAGTVARAPFGAVSLSGLTPLPFAAPTFDPLGGFATAAFTCRLAGFYQVQAVITIVGVPAANGPAYRIQKNNTDYSTGNGFNGGSAAAQISYTLADIIQLAIGDTLRCAVGNTGGSIAASTGSMSLTRIGG